MATPEHHSCGGDDRLLEWQTPTWCPQRVGRLRREAIHLPLSRAAERLCTALGGPSLEGKTLTDTRAPASRHTRAAAVSNENPREPKTPALGHAARWPKMSSGRPHREVREDRGRGSHRRRKSNTRKSWAWNRNKSSVGMALKAKRTQPWDLTGRREAACSVGVMRGVTVEAMNCSSTALEAKNCQPWALTAGSVSATVGRRGGALADDQLGVSNPTPARIVRHSTAPLR